MPIGWIKRYAKLNNCDAAGGADHSLALLAAWKAAGWGLWRRLHYTVFALVLALTAMALAGVRGAGY